ncbi:MAG: hypothetical protein F6K31_16245 [Symploca sp. SIO2G7]|nr:hypothetical protein [Symploca sp. SIO2G7]
MVSSIGLVRAQSTSSQASFLNGTWVGTFTCAQGLTKLRLDIEAKSPTDISAIFSFSEYPLNPGVPSGSFRMRGSLNPFNLPYASGELQLQATTWIDQPKGWSSLDLRGNASSSDQMIVGGLLKRGCSTFRVFKEGTQDLGPETTVANFHQAVANGNFDSLDQYYCLEEKVKARALGRVIDPENELMSLLEAYIQVASSFYSLDMSKLYYETKFFEPRKGQAVVLILGNVLLRSPDGRVAAIPYRQYGTLKREWLRLIKENGRWKLCNNLE